MKPTIIEQPINVSITANPIQANIQEQVTKVIIQGERVKVQTIGTQGLQGIQGEQGESGVAVGSPTFIQDDPPVYAGAYAWFDTSGGNLTLWIEDGL